MPAPRTIDRDSARTNAWPAREAAPLPDSRRAKLVPRHGSPVTDVCALEGPGQNGVKRAKPKRLAGFGCRLLGQLRWLAEHGARTIGIDVDPPRPVLCSAPGKPDIPWAEGRCPFPREVWEAAGFQSGRVRHG